MINNLILMSKKSLTNGVSLKVENRSGFDKSFFNALTTGIGTLTPICKQLILPNSDVSARLKISAQLPPLATDAFLRTHLKVEAFWTPLRLCYGGFESWFCGREVYDAVSNTFHRASLPNLVVPDVLDICDTLSVSDSGISDDKIKYNYGAGSLADYLGLYVDIDRPGATLRTASNSYAQIVFAEKNNTSNSSTENVPEFNIFPWICYGLIYDEYYRNKLVERPLFSPPSARGSQASVSAEAVNLTTYHLPYVSFADEMHVLYGWHSDNDYSDPGVPLDVDLAVNDRILFDNLLNGRISDLRQRNYGDDYFTAATPSAQEGNPIEVSVSSNKFSISALRLSNALQEFAEVNNFASPDYIQTLSARYGATLSAGIAQKPILVGSADFPMYTSGVEQTAQSNSQSVNTPFDSVGARYGRAHAEGSDFVCKFHADEPGYFMIIVSVVPEAQYYQGNAWDLIHLNNNSLTDLPCGLLEHIGNEPINSVEINASGNNSTFGYVQRYLAHKLGNHNQVHGLMRANESLGSFVVQRSFSATPSINSSFLKVKTTDLDNVAAVSGDISRYGTLIDSAIDLFVSEPLSESALPALSNPAKEHGRNVYVKTGGSKLA